ncbi:MAG: hypothetical protein KDC00_04105 [Flavobacteriales bacterium]|nr:hypothetical protein [Flavobacteriales bacterium]
MTVPRILLFAMWVIVGVACKREDPLPPKDMNTVVSNGTASLRFTFTNNGSPMVMDSVYSDGVGNLIRIDKLKFFISDIELIDADHVGMIGFEETYLLIDASAQDNTFVLGTVPTGHVHQVHVMIGLAPSMNHTDPLYAPAPLNSTDMHWRDDPPAQFKFLNLEGRVDGNADGDLDDPEDVRFIRYCATDELVRETLFHTSVDIAEGDHATIEVDVDLGVLMQGVDLRTTPVAVGGDTANGTLMNNMILAITGE